MLLGPSLGVRLQMVMRQSTTTIRPCSRLLSSETGSGEKKKEILGDIDDAARKLKREITDLPDKQLYPEYQQEGKGWVYDKKPVKIPCIQGKAYVWCACGRSHKQVITYY